MICAHCKTRGVTVTHVKTCSLAEQSIRSIGTLPETAPSRTPVVEAGMYQAHDGTIYKVQVAAHGSGHLYAKRLVVDEPDCGGCANGEPCGAGCEWKVRFEYAPGEVKRLAAQDRLTVEQAKAFGALYGTCVFCCKTLTDERSIHAGYGQKCASNNGLPWGEAA